MFKNRILVRLITIILSITVISQPCLAFPSILDDVPEKPMFDDESTLGTFSDENAERAFELLKYVGIISENKEEFEENKKVSRAYAVSAFAAISTGFRATGEAQSFPDVPASHKYAAGISQALKCGILDESTKSFYPNKDVTFEDIAKWALKSINYDILSMGKDPVSVAEEVDIFKGINRTDNAVSYSQFVRVLENVLNLNPVKLTLSGTDASYSVNEKDTLLSNKYNIYVQEGILTGYKYSSIYGDIDLEDGRVEINRTIYKINEEIPIDYVGYSVSAYIDKEDDSILSLWVDDSRNSVYEVIRDDYLSFDLKEIKSYTKRINLEDGMRVLKNNLFDGYYDLETAKSLLTTDKVVVVDNDGDKKGDLIKIYKNTHYYVKSISQLNESIALGDNKGTIDVGDGSLAEFWFEGKIIDPLTELKTNDVLTVLEGVMANGKRVFSAEVSRDALDGTITGSATDDLGLYYIIEDEKYYLSEELLSQMDKTGSHRKVGDYIQGFIGSDKKIVMIKFETDFLYGYVMNAKYDEVEEIGSVTLYTQDGEAKKFEFAKKIRVYNKSNLKGVKMEMKDAHKEFLTAGEVRNEIVAYALDGDGKVNMVAFAIDRTKNKPATISYPLTLDLNYTPTGSTDPQARLYRGILGSKYVMNSSTPVYIVPDQSTGLTKDEKAYQIVGGNKWSIEKYFQPSEIIRAYNCDKFYQPQFYVVNGEVVKNIGQSDGKVHFYVINKILDSYNEKEDRGEKVIEYYDNTTYKTVAIADNAVITRQGIYTDVSSVEQLKKGDVIQIHTNVQSQIDLMVVYFRLSEVNSKSMGMYYFNSEVDPDKVIFTPDVSSAMPDVGIVYGRVVDAEGNRVIVETASGEEYPVSVGGSVYGNPYFIVYDTATGTSIPASFAEIQPTDKVLMRRYYNHVQDVVIIR